MFMYQSMKWPSPSAFLPKLFRSSQGTPPQPDASPQKPKRWTFPVLPLPTLPSFRMFLPSLKTDENAKTTTPSNLDFEHFQICINLVHHIIDICAIGCLWLFSPVFRVTLDVFGFQGALKLWIHGLAIFLATTYGMYLLLWLAQEYIFQLASFYGILQTLVLIVSLRAEQEVTKGQEEEEDKLMDCKDEVDSEGGHPEDRWAGGEEDDEGVSQDEWESEGEEEVGHA
ncbi:uncharacterized protein C6orf47 homolog [Leptodactylus fuscus]